MAAQGLVLAIDQGTTSSRAIIFDASGRQVASAQRELQQFFPDDGWVEHDPEHIWSDTLAVCRDALQSARLGASAIAAIGITNQRETAVVWNRKTGRPVHKAIVWQDRRTAPLCRRLIGDGLEDLVRERTGLVIDAYFAGTKVAWILDNVEGARQAAERGELAFGTVDSFLLWRLTGGKVHATDATNASRTMLYDIARGRWDEDLLKALGIPAAMLPEVKDCSTAFGTTEPSLFGAAIPVTGMAGDQQAAVVGQACFAPGMLKSTYGTGCFALLNIGERFVTSRNRLLTTIAYRLNGRTTYALEGSIFIAGAAVQWVRDGLRAIDTAPESQAIALTVPDTGGVYLVPAFTGLGAPWWDPDARGAILGLTRASTTMHIVRAALEASCYQTHDLMAAMQDDLAAAGLDAAPQPLRVDGGMVANDFVCQYLADMLDRPVERPAVIETTALGAAYLAGLAVGLYESTDHIARAWRLERRFEPGMEAETRRQRLAGWHDAVARVRSGAAAGR
ncbi:glycerol kinase GlpK [Geminicoccaceae bacterium 1502E]|nr:glycerol kinase GlpK [Geminicoccaceae bacterium 1502E]